MALAWLDRLDALERRLADEQIGKLARWPSPRLDGVDIDTLRLCVPPHNRRMRFASRRCLGFSARNVFLPDAELKFFQTKSTRSRFPGNIGVIQSAEST